MTYFKVVTPPALHWHTTSFWYLCQADRQLRPGAGNSCEYESWGSLASASPLLGIVVAGVQCPAAGRWKGYGWQQSAGVAWAPKSSSSENPGTEKPSTKKQDNSLQSSSTCCSTDATKHQPKHGQGRVKNEAILTKIEHFFIHCSSTINNSTNLSLSGQKSNQKDRISFYLIKFVCLTIQILYVKIFLCEGYIDPNGFPYLTPNSIH